MTALKPPEASKLAYWHRLVTILVVGNGIRGPLLTSVDAPSSAVSFILSILTIYEIFLSSSFQLSHRSKADLYMTRFLHCCFEGKSKLVVGRLHGVIGDRAHLLEGRGLGSHETKNSDGTEVCLRL